MNCLFNLAKSPTSSPDIPILPIDQPAVVSRLLVDAKSRCADSFRVYLRQALAVFYIQVETQNTTPLQAEMITYPNKFLPFREHTPERLRFKGPEGPYLEDRIRTLSGIFSTVIWRALTANTPSAMREQIFFEDHNAWLNFVSRIPPSVNKSYLIDICARITPMPGKSSEKATDYWASIEELDWEAKIVRKASFMELYCIFHPTKNSGKRPFPFLGSIGAFHLVLDLAYTSIADKPTVQDVAECVTIIGRGAWNTLRVLDGDLESNTAATNQPTNQASLEGLKQAERLVCFSLTAQELEDTSFNLPTLEHLLCKFKGAWSKKMLV
ncbi:hypothetical protein CPB83DRAFT_900567 [Crepidotus variabilis]|uniref:Uncharacterized protein n=1 Tax=Crepidotus variabilis TaxID=179855 RepID=A0A9P6JHS5_9AGAR|nr:hypothetical protein CPB83DRAFT_900567 [Crepidotus variabilis]